MKKIRKVIPFCLLFIILMNSDSFALAKYFRTIHSGYWRDPVLWEYADDVDFTSGIGTGSLIPNANDNFIFIRSQHKITIDQSISIDQLIIEEGGQLIYGNFPSVILTINDGSGVDMLVNGVFEDSGPSNINWVNATASWQLGMNGSIIRTRSTSANFWRDHYEAGISSIPASSNWILRKQGSDNPTFSSINSFYGNLKIENSTNVFWDATAVGSKIIGSVNAPFIKGNLEIGSSSTSTNGIKFYSQNSAISPISILGNLIIHKGSIMHLEDAPNGLGSSGIELYSNLIVDGKISYDLNDANDYNRMLIFIGIVNQLIKGSGSIELFNLLVKKTSGSLILEKNISVDNILYLENGELNLNSNTLSMNNSNNHALQRNSGWVRSEANDNSSRISWRIDSSIGSYEFPFGIDSNVYIPFVLKTVSGDFGNVLVSTYSTDSMNLPYPIAPEPVMNLDIDAQNNSLNTVDRFWQIDPSGNSGVADLQFSYAKKEDISGSINLTARRYDHNLNVWEKPLCCQQYDNASRVVMVPAVSFFSTWTLMDDNIPLNLGPDPNALNVNSEKEILIFPIPMDQELSIKFFSEKDYDALFEIYNSIGVPLYSCRKHLVKGENCLNFDLFTIQTPEIMYLKFYDGNSIRKVKLLKN